MRSIVGASVSPQELTELFLFFCWVVVVFFVFFGGKSQEKGRPCMTVYPRAEGLLENLTLRGPLFCWLPGSDTYFTPCSHWGLLSLWKKGSTQCFPVFVSFFRLSYGLLLLHRLTGFIQSLKNQEGFKKNWVAFFQMWKVWEKWHFWPRSWKVWEFRDNCQQISADGGFVKKKEKKENWDAKQWFIKGKTEFIFLQTCRGPGSD